MSQSQIVTFFTGKIIFLTGCTGFLGKLLLEKLLRVCGVKMVYVLVRPKKGKAEADRYEEMFDLPLFEAMKQDSPDYMSKVHMITGDCAVENLGINEDNWQILFEETHVVIHCAATVRFDQALRTAYNINIRATRDLLHAAKRMKHLQSFIHVSTAYSNCPRQHIDEKVYEPPINDQQLDTLLKVFDDDELVGRITPQVLGDWPNTYSFTKCVGEDMVVRIAQDDNPHPLPVAIVRPSIVISTYKEPLVGWIDNFYGPIGVASGVGLGVLRTLHCVPEYRADMVPADYVVNSILATAWITSLRSDKQVEVYNYTSGMYSLNWKSFMDGTREKGKFYTSIKSVWRVTFTLHKREWRHRIDMFLLHTVPAHIVDFIAKVLGREPMMVDSYRKIHKFIDAINYFTIREWNFGNDKMSALWKRFNEADKKLFEIRISTFDWQAFFADFICGGRTYLINEPMSNLPEARRRYQRLVIAHWTIVSFVVLLVAYIGYAFYSIFTF